MHSATIPLAALGTFAAVYWLTPTPAAPPPEAPVLEQPAPIVEPAAPLTVAARAERSNAASSTTPTGAKGGRRARPRPGIASGESAARQVRPAPASEIWFSGCREVRAAGLAPLYIGQPGYREEMDGDGDGIACEPYRGMR